MFLTDTWLIALKYLIVDINGDTGKNFFTTKTLVKCLEVSNLLFQRTLNFTLHFRLIKLKLNFFTCLKRKPLIQCLSILFEFLINWTFWNYSNLIEPLMTRERVFIWVEIFFLPKSSSLQQSFGRLNKYVSLLFYRKPCEILIVTNY